MKSNLHIHIFSLAVILLAPLMATAADGQSLANTINEYSGGSSGRLQAIWDESASTVTVTNVNNIPVNDARITLSLNIDPGVKVLWKASITGRTDFQNALVNISGDGFEMTNGGKIEQTENGGFAIVIAGNITISGGTVSAGRNTTINATDANSTITVSGNGKVIQSGNSFAIQTNGNVEVKDNAEVRAVNRSAIRAVGSNSAINVSGGLVVNSGSSDETGDATISILSVYNTGNNVTINGTGKVQATGGNYAIYTSGGTITVSGGSVSANTNSAIYSESSVIVSGGTVSTATGSYAIYVFDRDFFNNALKVTVTGGLVRAANGYAISAYGELCTANVSGGIVFAYGNGITGENNVIYLPDNPSGFTGPGAGQGIIIAWNRPTGVFIYDDNTTENIITLPAQNSEPLFAWWDILNGNGAIGYGYGSNNGFIIMEDVEVHAKTRHVTTKNVFISDLATRFYNGAQQSVKVELPNNSDNSNIEVRYNGSETAPVNSGTYIISVSMTNNPSYTDVINMELGEFEIAKMPVTMSGITAIDKVYDGNTSVTFNGKAILSHNFDGENLVLTEGTAAFASANADNDVAVILSDYRLDGTAAVNYTFTQSNDLKANITHKPLTINGIAAKDKVYDGNNRAETEGVAVLNGIIDGESLWIFSGTATFENRNVGDNINVIFSDFAIYGSTAKNYALSQPKSVTAKIIPKPISIENVYVNNKVYDGNVTATVIEPETQQLSGVIDGDDVTVIEGKAEFARKNTGNGIIVSFSDYKLGGSEAINYVLSKQPSNVTANITPKTLTIAGFKISKLYDGNAELTENFGVLTFEGLVDGETATVDVSDVMAIFSANAPGMHEITFYGRYGMTAGTAISSNYYIVQPTGITGEIKAVTNACDPSLINPLRAWVRNGALHVTGLTSGKTISVYNASGALIHQSVAVSDEADIFLPAKGIYILKAGSNTMKVAFE